MDDKTVAVVIGVTAGVIGAYVGSATIRRVQEQIHQEELAEADMAGYQRGYNDVANNPDRMRKLLARMKGTEETED